MNSSIVFVIALAIYATCFALILRRAILKQVRERLRKAAELEAQTSHDAAALTEPWVFVAMHRLDPLRRSAPEFSFEALSLAGSLADILPTTTIHGESARQENKQTRAALEKRLKSYASSMH